MVIYNYINYIPNLIETNYKAEIIAVVAGIILLFITSLGKKILFFLNTIKEKISVYLLNFLNKHKETRIIKHCYQEFKNLAPDLLELLDEENDRLDTINNFIARKTNINTADIKFEFNNFSYRDNLVGYKNEIKEILDVKNNDIFLSFLNNLVVKVYNYNHYLNPLWESLRDYFSDQMTKED